MFIQRGKMSKEQKEKVEDIMEEIKARKKNLKKFRNNPHLHYILDVARYGKVKDE